VLVFGESEIRYLESLSPEARDATLARLYSHDIPAVLITQGFEPPAALSETAERMAVPLLRTSNGTPHAMSRLGSVLDNLLAPRTTIHGVLMDILGLGVLMIGESGIGKSECALDLVVRGHRLVADDTVELRCRAESFVLGSCPELTRHHMEIRGLGLINIQDLFGVASTRTSKRVELVVQLERWEPGREYDRLGLDDARYDVMGVQIPMIRMPVAPGRNIAILVEVAARNQLLRTRGAHAAQALVDRLARDLEAAADLDRGDDL
jgi:HPr kinase/phosphorylase